MNDIYSILLLEEDVILSRQIRQLLNMNNYNVFIASSLQEGMEMCKKYTPDVVVCDMRMRGGSGFQFLVELRNNTAMHNIVYISINGKDNREEMRTCMNLGADDYLPAPFNGKELLLSIKARLARFATLNSARHPPPRNTIVTTLSLEVPEEINSKLSKTETRVIIMIADGLNNKEIAEALGISTKTVENHRHNIARKLELTGHHALVKYAIRNIKKQLKITQ
ncbi:response regulator transcription factor [Chitinophaga pendula]|uniref:response regulator transcription factor n=1 Tax=Chitinophaga TaxID=79328 RepID=UPI000BAFBD12|nr:MULTISPECIES: response regulator transcription factor [Chitinophaga]ASZ13624.1 DNA-binding response regulator [Chitinophaga sp. MD30]UCJ08751.1 response regulator transcription factor [Chitinophaga pendula]